MTKSFAFVALVCSLAFTFGSCIKNNVEKSPIGTRMITTLSIDSSAADTLNTPTCTGYINSGSVTVYGGNFNSFVPSNSYPLVYVYIANYNADSVGKTYYITPVNGNLIELMYSATNVQFFYSGSVKVGKLSINSTYFNGSFTGHAGDTVINGWSFTAETFQ